MLVELPANFALSHFFETGVHDSRCVCRIQATFDGKDGVTIVNIFLLESKVQSLGLAVEKETRLHGGPTQPCELMVVTLQSSIRTGQYFTIKIKEDKTKDAQRMSHIRLGTCFCVHSRNGCPIEVQS